MDLILLGAPGAGKGTQGERLAREFGLVRISTGDLLREAVREGTPLGREARRYMDAGELVADDVILGLVGVVLGRPAAGHVFDGFPRTIAQAEALDVLLAETGRPLDAVVLIDVPDDVLVRRLSGRRSCPDCGAVYNVYFEPPRREGLCDHCGATLVERPDDAPDTVRRRLEVYREQTQPLIEYYRQGEAPLLTLNGDRDPDDVYAELKKAVTR